ncbi:MAG TPA: rhomboid family intramembrane serine protease [Candidatus Acidoferrales bacterium]|nr:rhomboid family intramembrane serine protease [Candidatus Acidoferrales bacterium]
MRRYSTSSSGFQFDWDWSITPAIKVLVLACTGVFLVQLLVRQFAGPAVEYHDIELYFGLVPYGVTHALLIWQPFTYLFLHAGIWHILVNMFVLWMFGRDVERAWGQRRFYIYYFLCGVGAGAINIIVKTILDPHGLGSALTPTLGASGAIYGVLIAAAVLFPHQRVLLIPFPVAISMRVYVGIMVAIEFFGTLGSGGDNVSHVCHLGGMLVGYLYLRRGSYLYASRNRISDWKRRRLARKFEVYQKRHRDEPPPPPENWVN